MDYEDFLDSKGLSPNFLNGKPYSDDYKKKGEWWSKLPMYKPDKIEEIVESIKNNQVTLIESSTGSGKSVLAPKYILKYFYQIEPGFSEKITMTTPKKMTTKSAAETSAETLDVELGQEVDYAYRGHKANPRSQLVYCTDGILLSKILYGDMLLKQHRAVIIDEAHERPIPTDILLYFLREILKQRPEFKVIIMSATIDPTLYLDYFKGFSSKALKVSGSTHHPIGHPEPETISRSSVGVC
jgi:HrpA-like RNA helicase